jgi:hypothetical protein
MRNTRRCGATIAGRGSVRMWLILAGMLAWCALALALWSTEAQGSLTLVPTLALAATLEISFFIHTGIERVGEFSRGTWERSPPPWLGRPLIACPPDFGLAILQRTPTGRGAAGARPGEIRCVEKRRRRRRHSIQLIGLVRQLHGSSMALGGSDRENPKKS